MEKMKDLMIRFAVYVLGLFIMACGIAISICSNLGVSPVSSFPYVVSLITKIDLGISCILVYIFFMLMQAVILGKNAKINILFQLPSSIIFGTFMSVTQSYFEWLVPSNYFMQLLLCFTGIFFVALGILLYVDVNIMPLPAEGVMQSIVQRFNVATHKSKIMFDCFTVTTAIILSLTFLGQLEGVREGTVISAFGVGICLKFLKIIKNKIIKSKIS